MSDYARFKILYEEGGLYFDTDVEVIKPFDDIIARGAFMGCERDAGDRGSLCQSGLGLGANLILGYIKRFWIFMLPYISLIRKALSI